MKNLIRRIFLTGTILLCSAACAGEPSSGGKTNPARKTEEKQDPGKIPVPVPDAKKALRREAYSYKDLAFFLRTLTVIRNSYVDQEKVTNEELLKKALKGLLRELDPFSAYQSPDQAKHLAEDTSGRFAGIGITIAGRGHGIEILTVFEGSPAERAGVKVGDYLVSVDGKAVSGNDVAGCVKRIKGETGSLVTLKLLRRGVSGQITATVRRGTVKVSSVVNSMLLQQKFGYMRITQFSATTPEDILKEMKKFQTKKIEGIIIDLRNNPGGLLNSAIGSCSIFLKTGLEVVSTNGRTPSSRRSFTALDMPKYLNLPIVILINGNSASAAEIFSGCLRDHKRAVLVGTKSFGKGSVQTVMPLGGNYGAMRLTTAKYYTPSKKVIHGVGITPDISVPVTPKVQFDLNTGMLNRTLKPGSEFDSLANRDPQFLRALDILKGIALYRNQSQTQK